MTLADEVRAAKRLPPPAQQRLILAAADVSHARVARELHVHPVTVTRWLAGTRVPRGELRARYADLLLELAEAAAG